MRRLLAASSLLTGALAASGCANAVPPPTALPPSAPVPVASAAPAVTPVPIEAPSAAEAPPPPPAPPRPEEPLPPLSRPFVTVRLPNIKVPLISVSGTGPREVVFLAQEAHAMSWNKYMSYIGTVVRSDGARVLDTQVPCPGYGYGELVAGGDEVLVLGSNMYFRNVPGRFWASLTGKKSWDCAGGYSRGLAVASGGRVWRLSCDHTGAGCTLSAPGMPRVKLPSFNASAATEEQASAGIDALWMRGAENGWMTHADGDGGTALLRYNGVTWLKKATLPSVAVVALWVDDGDQVWIAARRGGKESDPANMVLRFDGAALRELPVPATFAALKLRATGPKDVWFLGVGRDVYQWDGQRLRSGQAPFAVGDAWAATGGELWIVGTEEEDKSPGPGVAAHTASPAEEAR